MVGLPDGKQKSEYMCNRLDTIPACDGRTKLTNRQTSCDGIVRAMHTRRAVMTKITPERRTKRKQITA